MAGEPVHHHYNHYFRYPNSSSQHELFRYRRMRGELRQGHCLVGNLASILVNSVELALEASGGIQEVTFAGEAMDSSRWGGA